MTTTKTVPYGSDASAGTFECVDCGRRIKIQSKTSLPPCPNRQDGKHTENTWRTVSGQGDAAEDPYPNRKRNGE